MYTTNNTLTGDDTGVKALKEHWGDADVRRQLNSTTNDSKLTSAPTNDMIDDGI